jgi:hypothetical protein
VEDIFIGFANKFQNMHCETSKKPPLPMGDDFCQGAKALRFVYSIF